jgi:acetylornithine deacetylase/succinyl-diaminopimelate desuccinylase-like protein
MAAPVDVPKELLDPLLEWLKIPSVSTDPMDPGPIKEAAEWAQQKIVDAGGACELVDTGGNPLVVGEFKANKPDAKTVLVYGHYDVQDPEPLTLWTTPPFEPTIRDGRLYARGASDDKGNFWPILYTACEMARAGELGINVRVVCEGEEERGSRNTNDWLANDTAPTDACVIYDSGRMGRAPAITLGGRGIITTRITLRTGERDLHSGLFGGSVPNAIHELTRALAHVLPGPDGILRDELRAGVVGAPLAERERWASMPPGEKLIELAGGTQLSSTSGERYYEQNFWEPSLDVDEIRSGSPRTVIPCEATAFVSVRLAPEQRNEDILSALKDIVTDALPGYASVTFDDDAGCDAASFDPDHPVLQAARRAFTRAIGQETELMRIGGTLPLLDVLNERGIPTVLTGFATLFDNIHGPDESYPLESLTMSAAASRALFEELAKL